MNTLPSIKSFPRGRLNYKSGKEPQPQAQVIADFWTGLRKLSNNMTFNHYYDIQQDLEQYASRQGSLSLKLNGTTVELDYSLRSRRSIFVFCKGDKGHDDNRPPALANGTNFPWGSFFRVVLRDASDIIVFPFARLPSTLFVLAQSVLDQPDCNTLVLLFNPFKRMPEDDEEPETEYAFPEERRFGSLHPSCPGMSYAELHVLEWAVGAGRTRAEKDRILCELKGSEKADRMHFYP